MKRLAALLFASCLIGCGQSPEAVTTDSDSAQMPIEKSVDENRLRDLLEVEDRREARPAAAVPPAFRNIAPSSGAHFLRFNDVVPNRYFLPEVMGGGVAWFDFDRDGLLDLYATNGCQLQNSAPGQTKHVNQLFRSRSDGQFANVTQASQTGDNRYGQGCAIGDFNSDGFPDLYVTNYGRNTLFVNNGDGTFDDVTMAASVGNESWGTSAVWFDANSDGLADLYVVNYVNVTEANLQVCKYGGVPGYCGPGQWEGVSDLIYLNQGNGEFQIAVNSDMVDSKQAKGLAVAVCDFDMDQRPEIYVANDMAPNFLLTRLPESDGLARPLYRNEGDSAGCAVGGDGRNEASMGIACGDFDNDGLVDIFLSHYYQHKNTLYRNLGSLLFEDDSHRSRIAATSFETLGFGTVALDFDHDGDDDLFIANGHVLGTLHSPFEMRQQLLENDGSGLFTDASAGAGEYFDQFFVGRGAAKGDFNNDGRMDLAVSHLDKPMAILLNETQSPFHFIGLELLPKDRVYPAGGQVIVTAGGQRRVFPIVGGGSYLSASDTRIIAGLGNYEGPIDVTILWPGRDPSTFHNLLSDRYWLFREGDNKPWGFVSPTPSVKE